MKNQTLFRSLSAAVVLLILGCAGVQPAPSVCDTAPPDSVLCKAAGAVHMRLEDVGNVAIITNTVLITKKVYTAEQARNVLLLIRESLNDETMLYSEFVRWTRSVIGDYGDLLILFEPYFSSVAQANNPITAWDREVLVGWLDNQI